jgi:hypothetical protein
MRSLLFELCHPAVPGVLTIPLILLTPWVPMRYAIVEPRPVRFYVAAGELETFVSIGESGPLSARDQPAHA